jgi:hypothetical protein
MVVAFDSFDPSIVAAVRTAFPGVALMGSTSAAEMSSVGGFLEDSVTLALFASDDVDITVGLGSGAESDIEATCQAAVSEALAGTSQSPKVCIVLAEGFVAQPQLALDALARALPPGVVVVGGGSSGHDLSEARPSYQFGNDRVVQDGVAVLLLSGPVAWSVAVGTGWRTVGSIGTITRVDHGVVAEIDHRPAIEFVAPYLDVGGAATYGNPLAIVEAGADRSYLRAVLASDPASGALTLFGAAPVGATVQLTTANTEDILAGTRDALARAASEFPVGATPQAALMFSCAVRKFLLGSRTKAEVAMARAEFGTSVPLAGLYCSGEVGPILTGASTSRFLNETFVTVLLGT